MERARHDEDIRTAVDQTKVSSITLLFFLNDNC
jgi:hypothetical protein